jgi:PIN domain
MDDPSLVLHPPMLWSEGGRNVLAALRQGWTPGTTLFLRETLARIMYSTPPGGSVFASALLSARVWPQSDENLQYMEDKYFHQLYMRHFVMVVEQRARDDGARTVGERHLAREFVQVWNDQLGSLGIDTDLLIRVIQHAELGSGFAEPDLVGRRHGLLDTTIIIECQNLDQIDWRKEVTCDHVVLWVSGSVLNELDEMRWNHDSRRVRDRASGFSKWLQPRLPDAVKIGGTVLSGGARLRVWSAPNVHGMRDTAHLETALELRERGVPIHVVTMDMGMQARALAAGLPLLNLSAGCQLSPEPTPIERDLQRRARELEQ